MIEVVYVDHMGTDERVAQAARVSFNKEAAAFSAAQNNRLIGFLAKNGHWSPFAHCMATVRITAPIFVARQLQKHQVGLAWNEISRRYVDAPPQFYLPDRWRGRPVNAKQGSSNVEVIGVEVGEGDIASPSLLAEDCYRTCRETYEAMIQGGVAPEQARMVLPQGMMTSWYWTGSLAAWARVCGLRTGKDAQAETAEVAWLCADIIGRLFPVSWAVLAGCELESVSTGDAA